MHRQLHTQLFQADHLQMASSPEATPALPRTHRASNDDRRAVTDQLQAHYVAGRLSADELESRVEQALAAVTLGDLDMVLADLPTLSVSGSAAKQPASEHRSPSRRNHRGPHGEKSFRAHATSYLLVMVTLVAIWALTSPGGYFWPVWPMLGWGIGLAAHGLGARGRERSAAS